MFETHPATLAVAVTPQHPERMKSFRLDILNRLYGEVANLRAITDYELGCGNLETEEGSEVDTASSEVYDAAIALEEALDNLKAAFEADEED